MGPGKGLVTRSPLPEIKKRLFLVIKRKVYERSHPHTPESQKQSNTKTEGTSDLDGIVLGISYVKN